MKKVNKFFEGLNKEVLPTYKKRWRVTLEEIPTEPNFTINYINLSMYSYRHDQPVLELDQDDLVYLRKKYYDKWREELKGDYKKRHKQKLDDIEKKSKEINKLSKEIQNIKKELDE